jgi:hypothetical protein
LWSGGDELLPQVGTRSIPRTIMQHTQPHQSDSKNKSNKGAKKSCKKGSATTVEETRMKVS